MYLRKFGRNAHVIEPEELKNKMQKSVELTLERYKEELGYELL